MTDGSFGPERSATAAAAPEQRFEGLRVLAFCDYFSESSSGGAERASAEVYRRLLEAGAELLVVGGVPHESRHANSLSGVPARLLRGYDLSRALGGQAMVSPSLRREAAALVGAFQPNVLHAATIHFHSSLVAAAVARLRRLPLVTTAHLAAVSTLPWRLRMPTLLYERFLGRRVLRSSSHVIAVSNAVAAHVRSLGVPASGVSVVPNGVDHERFARRRGPHTPPHVVFVGRLIQNKGPVESLEAFSAAQPHASHMTFVGDGPLLRGLKTRVRELDLVDKVRFLGRVDDVAPVLATADILIRPSRTEGQSLAILEAMSAGVCVLASDIPANRELIEPGRTGFLVKVGDTAGLADQLRMLLRDVRLRTGLSSAAQAVAAPHSWEASAQRTGEVLAEVRSGWPIRS